MKTQPGTDNTDIIEFYQTTTRDQLVEAYKHFCKTKNKKRKKKDGFGKAEGNGLQRPVINGETYSWAQYSKLPKDAIIVHTFMLGLDRNYLEALIDEGFFNKSKKDAEVLPWDKEGIPYLEWLWINNEDYATKMYPSHYGFPPAGLRNQNYWTWMDKYNPKQTFGSNWEEA